MGKVGDRAHTPHGLGEVKEIITERGRKSFRVAGSGFSIWIDETKLRVANDGGGNLFSYGPMMEYAEEERDKPQYNMMMGGLESTIDPGEPYSVNEKNHTTLPWNGKNVQNHVDQFRKDQTILPGEFEFDPDDRLHPSDSLSGASRSKPSGPQPNPELFAGGGGDNPFWERDANQHALGLEGPDMSTEMYQQHMHDHPGHGVGPEVVDFGGEPSGPIRAAWDVIGFPGHMIDKGMGAIEHHRHTGSFERPAGLDNRYAFFEIEADGDSPAAQFRNDPQGFIRTCGHLWTDGDDSLEKFADYTDLLDTDKEFRTAAWTDVRAKAQRLRHEGAITVNDTGPNRMYASVQGDNGLYDVMIYKAGNFGGNQSILDWACSCEWGRWAFKRKFSYVGRLCSHAYATYLHMQSDHVKANPIGKSAASTDDYKSWLNENHQAPEAGSIANYLNTQGNDASDETVNGLYDYVSKNPDQAPERNFDTPYGNDPEKAYKEAELLRLKPLSMSPNLREVPQNTDHDWVDVTKDDRQDTGPDDIVHFSSVAAMQYLHGASEGITDFANAGVGGAAGAPGPGTGGTTLPDPNQSDPGGGMAPSPLGGGGLQPPSTPQIQSHLHYQGDVLDDLRNLEPAYESNGHMEERNDRVRDLTDKAQDEGFDASQFVASLHEGAPSQQNRPYDGDANFLGQSNPNWADMGFAGSGPDPKDWISDSAGYVKENEDPHVEKEWFDHPDDDIIKYNDSRSAPQQGPRKSSRTADLSEGVSDGTSGDAGGMGYSSPMSTDPGTNTSGSGMDQNMMASLHHEWDDARYAADDSGYFNPNNAGASDWDQASGEDLANSASQEISDANPLNSLTGDEGSGGGAPKGGGGAAGEAGGAAAGGEAAAGGSAAELAPLLLAAGNQDGFSLEAFDRGEFSFDDGGGTGELRRASRVGGGAKSQVRIDPGARGQKKEASPGQAPPEDFGYDGERELEAYLKEDQGDPSGMDILAAFQSSGGGAAVMGSSSAPRPGGTDDFASSPMVQAMLRTAGRKFSPEDQRELEGEFHPQGARNLPTAEELAGTHYAMGL